MKDTASSVCRENLKRLLKPRHIAFVGGKAVEDCINATRKSGFTGHIWAVHPQYTELAGVACVPSLADLPEPPDATLIAVSRERTVDVVAELNAMGAGGAVSIVGEFAETGEDGAALQTRLVTAAGDLALVGPNCLGVMNMFDGMAVWGGDNVFSPVAGDGVALISQSGYVAYSVTNVEQALPLGYAISMGNQAVLNVADYIDAMLDDPRVRAIGLYLEGIVDRPTTVNPNQRVAEKDGFIVWQMSSNNPYPRNSILNQRERLIVSDGQGYFSPEHPATSGVNELYFQYSGYLQPTPSASLEFEKLVETNLAGRVKVSNIMNRQSDQFGSANRQFTLAAYIHGNEVGKGVPTKEAAGVASKQKTDVIYVADIDTLSDFYVSMRETPIVDGVEYRYQNMSFVLNVIDALADEQVYLGLRNRKVDHVTLAVVEKTYESAMQRVFDLDQQLQIEYTTNMNKAESDIKAKLKPTEDEIQKELRKKNSNQYYDAAKLAAKQRLLEQQVRDLQEKYKNKQLEFENERSDKKRRIDLDAELEIQEIQRQFKLAAVILPPIPPMLVGLIVFTRRRLREREGISKARRLK